MPKKALIVIAAIAVMLVGATSVYGYYEVWDGWFNSGSLRLDDTYTFNYVSGQGLLEDTTAGSVDSFFVSTVTPSTFTCESGEYEGYTIKLWPGASGYKYTGQSGQKEAEGDPTPTWTGFARRYIPDPPNPPKIEEFDVWGTWNTRADGDYFDYTMCPCPPATPTYSAHWIANLSDPLGITGEGGSAGDRIDYED